MGLGHYLASDLECEYNSKYYDGLIDQFQKDEDSRKDEQFPGIMFLLTADFKYCKSPEKLKVVLRIFIKNNYLKEEIRQLFVKIATYDDLGLLMEIFGKNSQGLDIVISFKMLKFGIEQNTNNREEKRFLVM